jgi:hypothetical protein
VALRSFTEIHNYLGAYTTAELPNSSGATVQDANVEVGDIAYDTTVGDLVVCTDDTLSAAAWIATGSTSVGDAGELIVSAQKGTVGTINVGEVVYITGYDVGAGVIEVELADASAAATMPGYGIARTSFTQASTGTLVVAGSLSGQDTSTPEGGSWSVGDAVYVSETAGELTITKPTGTALVQSMGIIARVHPSQGVIQVFGAGRTNDLPNLAEDNVWVGNASGVPTAVALGAAPANVTKAAAAAGTSDSPARADHKHDITTAAPTTGIGGSNAEGSATSVARSDHNHALRTTTGPTDLAIGAIADGETLVRSGATIIGAAASGGSQMEKFDANLAIFPSSNPAQATSRNGHPLLAFDDTTAESVIFIGSLSEDYDSGSDLLVRIDWVAATAIIGAVTWGVEVEANAPAGTDLDADSFDTQQTGNDTTSGTSGVIVRTTITLTNAEADAIAAGNAFRLRLQRLPADGSDDLVGDAQVRAVSLVQ